MQAIAIGHEIELRRHLRIHHDIEANVLTLNLSCGDWRLMRLTLSGRPTQCLSVLPQQKNCIARNHAPICSHGIKRTHPSSGHTHRSLSHRRSTRDTHNQPRTHNRCTNPHRTPL
jgi:hypothetical protein